jgi:hypothetical protein
VGGDGLLFEAVSGLARVGFALTMEPNQTSGFFLLRDIVNNGGLINAENVGGGSLITRLKGVQK